MPFLFFARAVSAEQILAWASVGAGGRSLIECRAGTLTLGIGLPGGWPGVVRFGLGGGKRDNELRKLAFLRRYREGAAVALGHDFVAQAQAQACAFAGGLGGEKRLKDLLPHRRYTP